jgi:DnaD/phage-associated family protein
MAWIELHDTLPDHPKVIALAEVLGRDKDLISGKLIRLWLWALSNRESGEFRAQDTATVAEVMRFKGKPQRLIEAMVASRLLDPTEHGYAIHGWVERVGMLLDKRERVRAQTRERVRKHRGSGNGECNALHCAEGNASNAATVPKPYLGTDEEEDPTVGHHRARDEWHDATLHAVKRAYRGSFGREPTPEEAREIAEIKAKVDGMDGVELLCEAVRRAAINGARAVPSYVKSIVRDWSLSGILTLDQLDEHDYEKQSGGGSR